MAKASTVDLLRLNTLWCTKAAFLPPERYNEHTCPFGSPLGKHATNVRGCSGKDFAGSACAQRPQQYNPLRIFTTSLHVHLHYIKQVLNAYVTGFPLH